MQNKVNAVIDIKDDVTWIRCKKCFHKMFKMMDGYQIRKPQNVFGIEIKCSSCRQVNIFEW